ncbi:MarR family winged helix-turn-helix transcriptional regulator [Paenibacillus aceti]|uniref:HTH marR-type domain-containing protein n=1 Tax=Paenibacillus aceti TaxID=1820010 RepID=A0ABQ1W9C6_9BACL|nr:MarR family transcriptional regulator [Paenibacillus aceti]GGG19720.1 hypothetical protein GCM10010913_47310 [Paenibacillus aceti]
MSDTPKAQRLMEVFNRFRRVGCYKPALEGMKSSEIKVLFIIRRVSCEDSRGVTISAISNMMEVTSPTVTPLVRSLEKRGLVTRYTDEQDRRAVRIKLTEQGEAITRKAQEAYTRRFNGLIDYLGEEKSGQLADLLEQVFEYLDQQQARS